MLEKKSIPDMRIANIVFQSTESIYGKSLYAKEFIEYSVNIKIRNSGKNPVSLEMSFVPPYPLVQEVKEQQIIKAEIFHKHLQSFQNFYGNMASI